ncbi:hypothetical protein [Adhaeribacter pallidiroseus]|uniref:Uncharacterized protein n=1 Tax=Adhaeribacter pallidiroseus TaxID=2072847 RepID=A0A369QAG4_9BACT|nr:hypothetical protein [Adhaeribacter pallidiroseus]RDC61903.1 hypothetical protein AHMF7616_00492 [Adhaeribacter pallidiroseus]
MRGQKEPNIKKQPWLYSAAVDLLFVLSPPFGCLLAIIAFPEFFRNNQEMPVAAWVILVLLIDVSHVYSTLFRTYFDKETFRRQKQLMLLVPLLSWILGMLLYSVSSVLFWRILAYLAVYHFIRQQYGFMQLYSRKEKVSQSERQINIITIYTATVFPILYWHLEGKRLFNWFVPGDFIKIPYPSFLPVLTAGYYIIILIYVLKEIRMVYQQKTVNIPRNLVIVGTLLSWYLGIVHYNGDLIYTTFNVVSHGIPYLALVWIYGRKKQVRAASKGTVIPRLENLLYRNTGIVLFIAIVAFLAYLEEGFWDSLVWREHGEVFTFFANLPQIQDSLLLAIFVPLLTLPQITHYVLDGFIWKVSKDRTLN